MIELSKPPPLPNNSDSEVGFGRLAAWLGILLPVGIVAIAAGQVWWMRRQGVSADDLMPVLAFLGMAAFAFTFLGFCCSTVSFLGHGENRTAGWVVLGMLGLLLNVGLISSGVVGGVRAVKARSTDGLRGAIEDFNRSLKQDFETNGTLEHDPERLTRVMKSLDEVAASGSSREARIARATKGFLAELETSTRKLGQEGKLILQMNPMDPTTLNTRADLQIRQSTIENYRQRNEEVRAIIIGAREVLERQLNEAGLSESEAAPVVSSFWKDFEPRQEILLGIRDCDQRMVEAVAAALEIYDEHWGQWRKDEQGEFAGVEDPVATEEIFRLLGEIQKAGAEQAELQGSYLKSL
jgi:hypothetical protein